MIGCNIERLRGNYAKRIYVREAQMTKTMRRDQEAGGQEAERLRG